MPTTTNNCFARSRAINNSQPGVLYECTRRGRKLDDGIIIIIINTSYYNNKGRYYLPQLTTCLHYSSIAYSSNV
jgi:hypothetical protein